MEIDMYAFACPTVLQPPMGLLARLLPAAELVRAEAEGWAREQGLDSETLLLFCHAVSFAMARLARAIGLEAEVAVGDHVDCQGHFWVLVAEPQGKRLPLRRWESWGPRSTRWGREFATLLDLTATQFDVRPRPPRVVVLEPGAPDRTGYILDDFGDDLVAGFLWDSDKPGIDAFSARVMTAAASLGMIAPAAGLEEDEELAGVEPGLTVAG